MYLHFCFVFVVVPTTIRERKLTLTKGENTLKKYFEFPFTKKFLVNYHDTKVGQLFPEEEED